MAEGRVIAEGPPDDDRRQPGGHRRLPRRPPRRDRRTEAEERRSWPTRKRRSPSSRRGAAIARVTASLLEADDLVAGYLPEVDILNGCSLELCDGELVGIIGPNGAGKSTLLKALFGLVPVRAGTVDAARRGHHRRSRPTSWCEQGVGYVPQTNNVFPRAHRRGEPRRWACYLAPKRFDERFDVRDRAVPAPRRAAQAAGRVAVGRRAPDGGHGPGADDGAVGAAARRAVGRPVARCTRTRCSSAAGRSTPPACRS